MFAWLENTEVAIWVGVSFWAYPLLLACHIVGLSIVVGIFAVRDLRLAGVFTGLNLAAFLPLGRIAWVGFCINFISGLLLFSSQAVTFVNSTPFLIKISAIFLGMTLALFIQSRLRRTVSGNGRGAAEGSLRVFALASLACWLTAITAGRLIAYL